jgi:hypothetical protein
LKHFQDKQGRQERREGKWGIGRRGGRSRRKGRKRGRAKDKGNVKRRMRWVRKNEKTSKKILD